MITLYDYFRSTAAYRVRLALRLKDLSFTQIPIHLVRHGGEQFSAAFHLLNPQNKVPVLIDEKQPISQSLAIIEYLEERYPTPALLPKAIAERAYVRSIAQLIACDMHPLNNIRVLNYLSRDLGLTEAQKNTWYAHWIRDGFTALETLLARMGLTGKCCLGDTPTVADICLIPQVFNAHRFHCAMDEYPLINRIHTYCQTLPAFERARPEQQLDAEH